MKRIFVILFFISTLCGVLCSQVSNVLPFSANIANIQTSRTDNWTSFHNPASLVQTNGWQMAAQYENRYFLPSLNTALLQVGYTNDYLNVGIGYSFFGYAKYQEMMAGITLARSFKHFSLGVQANYFTTYCGDELGYKGFFVPQIGATITLLPTLTIGISSFNPFMQKLRVESDRRVVLPAIYSIATNYRWKDILQWSVQADYDVFSTFRIATGVEWQAIDRLIIKMGVYYHDQWVGCMGVAVNWNALRLDANFEIHPLLGVTCQARIGYKI